MWCWLNEWNKWSRQHCWSIKKNTFKNAFGSVQMQTRGFVTSFQFSCSSLFSLTHYLLAYQLDVPLFSFNYKKGKKRNTSKDKQKKWREKEKASKKETNWNRFFLWHIPLFLFFYFFVHSFDRSDAFLHRLVSRTLNILPKQNILDALSLILRPVFCCCCSHSNVNVFYLLAWHLSSNLKCHGTFQITWKSFHRLLLFFTCSSFSSPIHLVVIKWILFSFSALFSVVFRLRWNGFFKSIKIECTK